MDLKTDEKALDLIEAYKRMPLLWDMNHKDYYRKKLKWAAWKKVGEELGVSATLCKKKVDSLLASYRREKRKIRNSVDSGSRNGNKNETYKSKWFAYEALKFLDDKDFPQTRITTETDTTIKVENSIGNEFKCVPVEQIVLEETSAEEETTTSTLPLFNPRSNKRAREQEDYNSTIMNSSTFSSSMTVATQSRKEPSEPLPLIQRVMSEPNETDTFFTYVSAKMRKYSPETQNRIQHAVFDLLVQADRGVFDASTRSVYSQPYVLQMCGAVPHPAIH